jgi:hypothetical protein
MAEDQLEELERKLSFLSHSEEAIRQVQIFCDELPGTKARLALWNADNAMLRRPIQSAEASARGFDAPDDFFTLLQGDVVTTESAYFLGERVTGRPHYAVLNSSCDLVPGRSAFASLLRISPIRSTETNAKEKLGTLLKFSRRDSMYLPVFPDDDPDLVGNVIQFDGFCQIRMPDLLLANRIASLSLVGWRIFASLTRAVFTRANPREIGIRTAIEKGLARALPANPGI